jgi:hypothetical protein
MTLRQHLPKELPESGFKAPEREAINKLIRAMRMLEPISTPNEKVTIGPEGMSRKSIGSGSTDTNAGAPLWR